MQNCSDNQKTSAQAKDPRDEIATDILMKGHEIGFVKKPNENRE